ncbi:MAG: DUF4436 family protein [Caldilineaceae bacterium]
MFQINRIEIILTIIIFSLCGVTAFVVNYAFVHEEGDHEAVVQIVEQDHFADGYIEIDIHVVTVEPVDEFMTLDLEFHPHGRFDGGDGLLAIPLEVDVSSRHAEPILFEAGKRMFPHEVTVDFYAGEAQDYPFDEHRSLLELAVIEEFSADGNWMAAPTKMNFLSYHHGFTFVDTPLPPSPHGYTGFEIRLKRSPLVLGTAIFLMAIIWGFTLVNLALLVGTLTGKVEADFGLFGYMSGFVVAIYFFREVFPDIPPYLGVFSDYIAFFWAIIAAAGISNVVAVKWLISVFKDEDGAPEVIEF